MSDKPQLWAHFKYIWHDTLPGWSITFHNFTLYGGDRLNGKVYVIDELPTDGFAWFSLPVNYKGDAAQDYVDQFPLRFTLIDWKIKSVI